MNEYSQNAWKYYEYGWAYNNSLRPNQYRLVETNAQRAPVTGMLAGGATDTKEEDPFIAGFNRYR